MCDFATGWIAGMIGVMVGHPLDTVKVNQQTQGLRVGHCMKEIYRQFGVKGYFRGVTFPVIANGAINSVLFGVYRSTLDALNHNSGSRRKQQQHQQQSQAQVNYWHCYIAGATGGLAAVGISCPVDLIKIKLQTQKVGNRSNLVQLLGNIWRTNGVAGFYHGNVSMLIRDTPSYGVYMVTYEFLANWTRSQSNNEAAQTLGLFAAGGIAGTIAWWVILPIDAIKSRLQAADYNNKSNSTNTSPQYNGIMHCANCIFKEQSLKGFFRGFWALTVRAFPVNGAIFLSVEWLNYLCQIVIQQQNKY